MEFDVKFLARLDKEGYMIVKVPEMDKATHMLANIIQQIHYMAGNTPCSLETKLSELRDVFKDAMAI